MATISAMLKLYGHLNPLSLNTLKIRVALAEASAPYQYVTVDLAAGEQREPGFLALNPHGKVPVLVDGDFVLPEPDPILFSAAKPFPAAPRPAPSSTHRARAHDCGASASAP